ncbi:hypothetical protein [Angelakisella massiliensis]|uniref:hypothetical protein n=1 Tax=Angelakisella massiliensis TaxID=1871018 RepID=UPI0024B211CD|nr:hypothetical protein [Angelakisella massiliensis]
MFQKDADMIYRSSFQIKSVESCGCAHQNIIFWGEPDDTEGFAKVIVGDFKSSFGALKKKRAIDIERFHA